MLHKKNIFITGITGNQGSAVAKHLLDLGYSVIGLTRNANSEKANNWKSRGVTIIEGNINNPELFESYIDQADAIYLVQA